jgi:transaldolase
MTTDGTARNPLQRLHDFGQAPWLDYIDRELLEDGGLARLVREDGVTGVTSNPSIFEQAIGRGSRYDAQLEELVARDPELTASELYERLAVRDIQGAADVLRPVYDRTGGADGFVSLEVSPHLAHDTAATMDEARRLWRAVARPNLMIKVPATRAGLPAIAQLTAEGVHVNVTLMFSLAHYDSVSDAYLEGLARREGAQPLERAASVASFFVSRVDTKVDPELEQIGTEEALELRGTIAVANAKRAYRRFTEVFGDRDDRGRGNGGRYAELRRRGARVQRVLFGSTSTKNPAYSEMLYVEELIGPDTVNTLPPKTLDAFRERGEPRESLTEGWDEADARIEALGRMGIDLDEVTEELQREGVAAFARSFDQLLESVEAKRRGLVAAI